MLEPAEVLANEFEDSHLYDKLRSMVVVSPIYEVRKNDIRFLARSGGILILDNANIREQVKTDYENRPRQIRRRGIDSVT